MCQWTVSLQSTCRSEWVFDWVSLSDRECHHCLRALSHMGDGMAS